MRSHTALARLAERQFGVVAAFQLAGLGYSTSAVGRAVRAGRLQRVHRAVYAVGHGAIGDQGRATAALLAVGGDAALSHGSAAWLWGLVPSLATPPEVTTTKTSRSRAGLRVHNVACMRAEEWGVLDRLAVSSIPRTLLDLATAVDARGLVSATDRARRLGHLDPSAIDRIIGRHPGRRGCARLAAAVELYRTPVFDRARSELLFLRLVRKAGLPPPALNTWVIGFEIDAWWEAEQFAVEVDGWEAHGDRRSFEADRLRSEDMRLAGIDAIRITARRIEREPRQVGRRLALLLERRRRELKG